MPKSNESKNLLSVQDVLPEDAEFEIRSAKPTPVQDAEIQRDNREQLFGLIFRSVVLVALLLAGAASFLILLNANATQDVKEIAKLTVPAVITAFLGFALGKSS